MTSLQGSVAITARANRPGAQNSLLYSGRETAAQQTQACPDIADDMGWAWAAQNDTDFRLAASMRRASRHFLLRSGSIFAALHRY